MFYLQCRYNRKPPILCTTYSVKIENLQCHVLLTMLVENPQCHVLLTVLE